MAVAGKDAIAFPSYTYQSGFGNNHASEAVAGALPVGRNSPQRHPLGLYAEKFSASAFTAPSAMNFRSWMYRIRPSVMHGPFTPLAHAGLHTGAVDDPATPPDQLRWDAFDIPTEPLDFVDGLRTMAANGDVRMQAGLGIHLYLANQSMSDRYFYNADGELLIVPQTGTLDLHTEMGPLSVAPGSIAVIPRGIKFQVRLSEPCRGYICENYGAILQLPERGPIGTDGLANARDFEYPRAAYDTAQGEVELVAKLAGNLFRCTMEHSPLDVVGWHGNLAPYRYDLTRFNTIGSISYDHPDPSIFTVLTSQSDTPGTANVDFVIFPPRWLVMQDTFRPPWYHRNIMSEFMGLIYGVYDAKPGQSFAPGGASLHNCMSPHGPDATAFENASNAQLLPEHLANTMAFMFESRYLIQPTAFAMQAPQLQKDYLDCWQALKRHFKD